MARLFSGIERRSTPENPNTPLTSSTILDLFGGTPTDAGIRVTPLRAMGFTPVWRAVRLISETISSLPLKVYRRTDRGREEARDHPAWQLLHDRPNEEQTSQLWRETILAHLLLWGNAYCEIERTLDGEDVLGLWPLPPDRVRVKRVDGERIYDVTLPDTPTPVPMASRDILHIPGLGYDGLIGYSPLTLFREAIGLGVAMETYTAKWFGNGAHIGGFLEHPKTISDEADRRLKAKIQERSGLDKAHRLWLLEEGMTYRARAETPEHSQLKDGRVFQVQDIGRIFGVPPHMLYDTDRPFQSNVENEGIEFLTFTLRGWLVRCEQVYNWAIFTPTERSTVYSEHDVSGLLRGDFKTRMEGYELARRQGLITANQVAQRENWPPIDSAYGDAFLVQQNQVMIAADGTIIPLNTPTTGTRSESDSPTPQLVGSHEFRSRLHDAFAEVFLSRARLAMGSIVTSVRRAQTEQPDFRSWCAEYFGESTAGFIRSTFLDEARAFVAAVAREALAEVGAHVERRTIAEEIGGRCTLEVLASFAMTEVARLRQRITTAEDAAVELSAWEDDGAESMARSFLSAAGATAAARALTLCPENGQKRMIAVL